MSAARLFSHITKDLDRKNLTKCNIGSTRLPPECFANKTLEKLLKLNITLATYRFRGSQEHVKIPFLRCEKCKNVWKLYKYLSKNKFDNMSPIAAIEKHVCNGSTTPRNVFKSRDSQLPPCAKNFLNKAFVKLQAKHPTVSSRAFCSIVTGSAQ